MRTEQEMFNLILDIAEKDERIRAVVLNGSRTNSNALKEIEGDKLCRILLDKDNCLPEIPKETDKDHWVKKPTERQFLEICNEYWWSLNNVAKGLWREEVPYVMDMINYCVRPQLIRLLGCKIIT